MEGEEGRQDLRGEEQSCGGGGAWSWGAGSEGQLATGRLDDETVPQFLPSLSSALPISQIACGGAHAIALTGKQFCYVFHFLRFIRHPRWSTPSILDVQRAGNLWSRQQTDLLVCFRSRVDETFHCGSSYGTLNVSRKLGFLRYHISCKNKTFPDILSLRPASPPGSGFLG